MKLFSRFFLAFSIFLFSFSLGYLISSVLSWRYHLSYKFARFLPAEKLRVSHQPTVGVVRLEREGFFNSGVDKLSLNRKKSAESSDTFYSVEDLILKGTIICSQCRHSIAILKDKKTKKTRAVSIGESVKGFKIMKIMPDEVFLERDGKRYVLKLFEKRDEEQVSHSVAFPAKTSEPNEFRVERKRIEQDISSGEFLKFINIVPVNKPVKGLRVNYVNPRSFVYKLGIRPGDIIIAINDIHIRTPEDSFSAFEQLKSAEEVTITVFRQGKKVKLRYELE